MANPTSNFGWQMPTSTDLVTDLPADFEVFGQAVDTDLADLKGGTTGQILSKTSNTDLDFTWINNDQGDITEVVAGSGLTGGGSSGSVSLAFDYAAGSKITVNAQTGTTYTFVLTDADQKLITASNASAQTYTIPPNSSVAYAIGTIINVIQIGAGQVTFSQGSGVTIASNGATSSAPKLRVQYSSASAIKVGTDSWYIVGDLA